MNENSMSYFKKRVKKIQIQNNCIFESQQKKSWKQKMSIQLFS